MRKQLTNTKMEIFTITNGAGSIQDFKILKETEKAYYLESLDCVDIPSGKPVWVPKSGIVSTKFNEKIGGEDVIITLNDWKTWFLKRMDRYQKKALCLLG